MKHFKFFVSALVVAAALVLYFWPKGSVQKSNEVTQAERPAKNFPTGSQLSKAEFMKARSATADLKSGRAPATSVESPKAEPTSSVRQTLQSLPRSQELLVNKLPRRVLLARAIPKAHYTSAMGLSVMEQNGFMIVPQSSQNQSNWKDIIINRNDKPVLFNPESHQFPEIVTGTLVLELNSVAQAAAVASRQNLKLMHSDPRISRAYFQVPDGYALLPGLKAIEQDPAVKSIEVETLHGKLETR